MKKARFSEVQMVKIQREADEAPVSEVAKKPPGLISRKGLNLEANWVTIILSLLPRFPHCKPISAREIRMAEGRYRIERVRSAGLRGRE
jgi:hypothetical protein